MMGRVKIISECEKMSSLVGYIDKRVISKTTFLTTPELFIGLIQAIWCKNEHIWLKKTPGTLQKTAGLAHLWPENQFFLRYAHKTHFFGLRQT